MLDFFSGMLIALIVFLALSKDILPNTPTEFYVDACEGGHCIRIECRGEHTIIAGPMPIREAADLCDRLNKEMEGKWYK